MYMKRYLYVKMGLVFFFNELLMNEYIKLLFVIFTNEIETFNYTFMLNSEYKNNYCFAKFAFPKFILI